MNTTFTINGATYTTNATGKYFYVTDDTRFQKRVSRKEYEEAKHEYELTAEQETTELVLTEHDNMVTITPEDIERDARELERYIEETEESNTDLEVAEIAEQMLDAAAEDPEVSLEEYVEKVKKVEKAKKTRKSKDIAFTYTVNGKAIVTLTAKQVDFIHHLPDTCFWENGLDSTIWVDCLCDDIQGQFANKPMTVGAMISTLCEKGLGTRSTCRREKRKCTSFELTELGKQVFANPEWGLN